MSRTVPQEVRVRVGDQDLGLGIIDEVTVDGAVWKHPDGPRLG